MQGLKYAACGRAPRRLIHARARAAPLYQTRAKIVKGEEEPPAEAIAAGAGEAPGGGAAPAGIPEFWLGVLRANEVTANVVRTCSGRARAQAPWPLHRLAAPAPCPGLGCLSEGSRTRRCVWQR